MPDPAVHIWIVAAISEYNRSRGWLDKQIEAGKLRTVRFPGDRKLYLFRAELDALLSPQTWRRDSEPTPQP